MGDQQFFLKWNDFQTNMVTSFRHLRDEKSFTDVSTMKYCNICVQTNWSNLFVCCRYFAFSDLISYIADPATANIFTIHDQYTFSYGL